MSFRFVLLDSFTANRVIKVVMTSTRRTHDTMLITVFLLAAVVTSRGCRRSMASDSMSFEIMAPYWKAGCNEQQLEHQATPALELLTRSVFLAHMLSAIGDTIITAFFDILV
jgi:hypothetical protein